MSTHHHHDGTPSREPILITDRRKLISVFYFDIGFILLGVSAVMLMSERMTLPMGIVFCFVILCYVRSFRILKGFVWNKYMLYGALGAGVFGKLGGFAKIMLLISFCVWILGATFYFPVIGYELVRGGYCAVRSLLAHNPNHAHAHDA